MNNCSIKTFLIHLKRYFQTKLETKTPSFAKNLKYEDGSTKKRAGEISRWSLNFRLSPGEDPESSSG